MQVFYIWRNTVLGAITDKVADLHRAHGSHHPLRGEEKRRKGEKEQSRKAMLLQLQDLIQKAMKSVRIRIKLSKWIVTSTACRFGAR